MGTKPFLAAVVFLLSLGLVAPSHAQNCTPTPGNPCVWRDEWGVPHIEAACESDAWYAMGYEEARDALFHVQCHLKWYTGHAAEYFGHQGKQKHPALASGTVLNDFVVKAYQLDLERLKGLGQPAADQALQAILVEPSLPNPSQVYENLVAYAAGLDAYRQRLDANVGLNGQESATRSWIVGRGDSWVLTDPIDEFQVASYSGWLKGIISFGYAMLNDPTTFLSTCLPGAAPALSAQDLSSMTQMEQLRALFGGLAPIGSNAFGWSGAAHSFVEDENEVSYTGVMADPHKGVDSTYAFQQANGQGAVDGGMAAEQFIAHVWNCHLVVPSTELDVYGNVHHGSGNFFVFHNQDVAVGGSASIANLADAFMLRLEQEEGDGSPVAEPKQYYSYYASGFVPLDGTGGSNVRQATIPVGGASSEIVDYWHLPSFGLVFCDQPWRSSHVVPPGGPNGWVPDALGNLLGPLDPPTVSVPSGEIPVIFAVRAPVDQRVDGSSHFRRIAVGGYRMLHATSVTEVQAILGTLDPSYVVNFIACDRDGGLFATRLAAVPERGDDTNLPSTYTAKTKAQLYDKLSSFEPVPACWPEDEVFDWRWTSGLEGVAGNLRYLLPVDPGTPPMPFLPHVLHLPGPTGSYPPKVPLSTPGVPYDNPGFATVSNDETYLQAHERLEYQPGAGALDPTGNQLAQDVIDANVLYHSLDLNFVSLQKNQAIMAHLKRIAQDPIVPSMTIDEARRFAQDDRLHRADDYPGYVPGGTPPVSGAAGTPAPVRQFVELAAAIATVEDQANQDAQFLVDLYQTLKSGAWSAVSLPGMPTLDLGQIFLHNRLGGEPKIVRFEPGYTEYDMPPQFPLVDFYPREIRLSGTRLGDLMSAGPVDLLGAADVVKLNTLVSTLGQSGWGAQAFEQQGPSAPAALLGTFFRGLSATRPMTSSTAASKFDLGHSWVPILTGGGVRYGVTLPAGVNALESTFPVLAQAATFWDLASHEPTLEGLSDLFWPLMRVYSSYDYLHLVARPKDPWSSVMGAAPDPLPSGLRAVAEQNVILGPLFQDAPISALYKSGDPSLGVKDSTELTAADVNAFVDFLLALGGFAIVNGTVDKVAKIEAWENATVPGATPWRDHYPLTRTMVLVSMIRRLLQTDDYLAATSTSTPTTWEARFVTRAFDFLGNLDWPPTGLSAPCAGESIRSVLFTGDTANMLDGSYDEKNGDGFREYYIGQGGTYSPILTLFPLQDPEEEDLPPLSFSFVVPGERINAFDSPYQAAYMDGYASGLMPTTHYSDYRTHQPAVTDPGLPASPYTILVTAGPQCP